MMRCVCISALVAVAALTGEARIDAVHKVGLPDQRPGMSRERFTGTFDNCSLFAEYTFEDGKIVRKRWGDYFFNLSLGYSPKNGGWDRWDAIKVMVKTDGGRKRNVLAESLPKVFFGYSANGADFLAAEWECDGGRRVRLRFAAFPSHRDWLFLKVDFSDAPIDGVWLSAYPGNAAVPEGRERHLATKERDWHVNMEKVDFKPVSPYLLMYSRYVDDRFGNKVVYDIAPVKSVVMLRSISGMTAEFRPQDGATEMTFALGYFANADPDDQLVRFLGEDGDAINGFMKTIDWDALPGADDFRKSVNIARSMGMPDSALSPVVRRFAEARKARDVNAMSICMEEIAALRRKTATDGLAAFSK